MRRRRAVVGVGAAVALVALIVTLTGPSPPSSRTAPPAVAASAKVRVGLRASVLSTSLPAPVSRETVVGLGHRKLLLMGGMGSSGTSTTNVDVLDTATGAVSPAGALALPTHDAAGAVVGGQALDFGGGQTASVTTVQSFSPSGATAGAQVVGQLPAPRSDATAAVIGRTAYVVGGYDGSSGDPQVLSTSSGRTFSVVASLPVAVRYAAVTAANGKIYVFGGQAVTGPRAGLPVDDVQVVDPAKHRAVIAGHLPEPVEGAVAVDLGGRIYVAGGNTDATPNSATADTLTVAGIWKYDPRHATTTLVGRLPVAVSHAGAAVTGGTAWIVGGETDGTVQPDVQKLSLTRH